MMLKEENIQIVHASCHGCIDFSHSMQTDETTEKCALNLELLFFFKQLCILAKHMRSLFQMDYYLKKSERISHTIAIRLIVIRKIEFVHLQIMCMCFKLTTENTSVSTTHTLGMANNPFNNNNNNIN